jgi:hypothetical protein
MPLSPELIGALTGAGIGGLGLSLAGSGRQPNESAGDRRRRFLSQLAQGSLLGGLAGGALGSNYAQKGVVSDLVNKVKELGIFGVAAPAPGVGAKLMSGVVVPAAKAVNTVRGAASYPLALGTAAAVGTGPLKWLTNWMPANRKALAAFEAAVNAPKGGLGTATQVGIGNLNDLQQLLGKQVGFADLAKLQKQYGRHAGLAELKNLNKLQAMAGTQGLYDANTSQAVKAFLNRMNPADRLDILAKLKDNVKDPIATRFFEHAEKAVKAPTMGKVLKNRVARGGKVGAAAYLADWLLRNRLFSTNSRSADEVLYDTLNQVYPKK